MKKLLKTIFLKVISVFNRRHLLRLSRLMMNVALGNNNDDRQNNGECFLLVRIFCSSRDSGRKSFIVFDVGAQLGYWTNFLINIAKQHEKEVTVHCFEPSKSNFAHLQDNLKKIEQDKIFFVNEGMGNVKETKELYLASDGPGTNSLYKRRVESLGISFDESETICINTIDVYCNEHNISHIDFIKIDVEGHELSVLKGAKSLLERGAIDYVQFEYGGCWIDSRVLFMDAYDFLAGLGYMVGKIMPNGIEFYEKYDQRLETYQMANFLACKPSNAEKFKRISPVLN